MVNVDINWKFLEKNSVSTKKILGYYYNYWTKTDFWSDIVSSQIE
jgi:hypothetical protein